MKILFCSHAYAPSVGGVVTVAKLLIPEFLRRGHELVVATTTRESSPEDGAWNVVRSPGPATLSGLVRWSELVFHNHICLQLAWPLVVVRRPWVVAHHIWVPAQGTGRIKRIALRHARGISVSDTIAKHLDTPSVVIPNPYDGAVFTYRGDVSRDLDLIFVGRLIRDKGAHLLLSALSQLQRGGMTPTLTIVGEGPEEVGLRDQARKLGVEAQIVFAGTVTGAELAALLNRHRIMVVPSVWQEPFGIVALEGMACGCAVLVSDCDGLLQAIGDAGESFRRNDPVALASGVERLLRSGSELSRLRERASAHLQRHRADRVADKYLQVMADARRDFTGV